MGCVRIKREGDRYEVSVTNPDLEKENYNSKGGWKDPDEEYQFETWDQVKTFLDKVVEKALPVDEYSSAFAKAAKESMSA